MPDAMVSLVPRQLVLALQGAFLGLLTALLVAGCGGQSGPARGAVAGKVTVDGEPLKQGVISYRPTGETKGPSAGSEVKGGRYSIPRESGPLAGKYRVEISAKKGTGKMIEVPEPAGTKMELTVEALPKKYNSETTLEREIKVGNNSHDFELQSK